MHPLKELQKLLIESTPRRAVGKVVRMTDTSIDVVVSGRIRNFKRGSDGTTYRVGDKVATQGEVLLGRTAVRSKVKTYYT